MLMLAVLNIQLYVIDIELTSILVRVPRPTPADTPPFPAGPLVISSRRTRSSFISPI